MNRRTPLSRRRLGELFRRAGRGLAIGVCTLGVSVAGGNLVGSFLSNHLAQILTKAF